MKHPSRQSVQVEADIAAAYKQIAEQAKVSVSEVIRRVGHWLSQQPDYIVGEVLGTTPASLRGDVAKMILERVVAEESPPYGGMPAGTTAPTVQSAASSTSSAASARRLARPHQAKNQPGRQGR